jgi:hypothetical protein
MEEDISVGSVNEGSQEYAGSVALFGFPIGPPLGWKVNQNRSVSLFGFQVAMGGRFRANGYVCRRRSPFQNLSRNHFPPPRFPPTGDSEALNGTA